MGSGCLWGTSCGYDKCAPPILAFAGTIFRRDCVSEGPACQVRRAMLDYPRPFIGHDKRAPPMVQPLPGPPGARGGRELSPRVRGDVRGLRLCDFGGTYLSGPLNHV